MFDHVIRFSVRNKVIIGIGVVALILWGLVSIRQLPIDAVPDITNNQVQVVTTSPSLTAEDIERLVTTPIEVAVASIPDIEEVRSISRFGLSVVTIVFHDNIDVYWARAQVSQRLVDIQGDLAADADNPTLAPVTTGLGEIYQYVLRIDPAHRDRYTESDLRTIQDWTIRRRLLGTPGVADVSSFGGNLKQLEVAVDVERLRSFGLSIKDVANAVEENNGNAGSAYIEHSGRVAYIRSEGRIGSMNDVAGIALHSSQSSIPVRLRDVATIGEGRAIRYGAMTIDDDGESVGGIVLMLKGANSSTVIDDVKARMAEVQKSLPEGITIEPFLDRATLVNKAIGTVATNLIEGALIVIFVLVLMLGNLRAGFVVASVIPLAMLFAIGMMVATGVSGNLMSLGALDFGLIVDAAVIIVEHVLHSLALAPIGNRDTLVADASIRMRRSASIGEFIILIVYVPILALTGIEGRMFVPMAQTVIYAIIGAFILSLTWVPMVSALVLRQGHTQKLTFADRLISTLQRWYRPIRNGALRHPKTVLTLSIASLAAAVFAFMSIGGEFLPQLDEGDFAVELRLPTGASVDETARVSMEAASILLKRFPEVRRVVGKIGTSEIPLDPMPMSACDLMVILKDKREWTSASSREELASKMQEALEDIPGVEFGFQQPIQMRFNELMTGARQDVAVKIFGPDLDTLAKLGEELGHMAERIEGATDLYVEPVEGLPQLVATIDRDACARVGVDVADVNAAVRSFIAGEPAGVYYEEERKFDIVIRLDSNQRRDENVFRRLPILTSSGTIVPLEQVAEVATRSGPNQIQHENTRRRITVGFNVRGRDVKSIVDDLNSRLGQELRLPDDYYITIGGQFENLATAERRLMIVVPVSLLIILVLLYMTFKSIKDTLIIFTAVPLAAVGGIAALLLRGMPFSISAGVGFIALFGVAVLNGIVLISSFQQAAKHGYSNIHRIILHGTVDRLRPVLMTALVASLGFLPMALSTSDGAEVQRPLATVVIGGLVTSTLLTLVVLPVLYGLVHRVRRIKASTVTAVVGIVLAIVGSVSTLSAQTTEPNLQTVTRTEALRLALERHPDLLLARSAVEQQQALSGLASVDIGRTSLTYMTGQYNSSARDNNLTLQQTLPFPTVWFADASLADHRTDVARSELQVRERGVRIDIERTFEQIAYLRTVDSLLTSHDSILIRAVEVARTRERVGEGTRLALISLESQRKEIATRKLQTQADLLAMERRLQTTCGGNVQPVHESMKVIELPADSLEPPIVAYMQSQALLAEAETDASRARLWPDITLGWFSQTLTGTPLGSGVLSGPQDRFTGVSIGLQVPLWIAPDIGRLEQAAIAEQTAKDRTALQKRTIDLRRTAQRSELDAARKTLQYYIDAALPEIDLLLRQSSKSWEVGEISYLEHHMALGRAFDVRTAYYNALLRHNLLNIEYSLFATP